jgi:selenocysteine-specific elongation factor
VSTIRERLQGTAFAEAPIVPTSVVTGRGLDELKSTIARELSSAPPPRDIGKPRLAIDRVFTLAGAGTVVTGTLAGGTLRRGQSIRDSTGRPRGTHSTDPVTWPRRGDERARDAHGAESC